jgi:membrane fusion protein (multidrug efflux system)
VQTVAPRAGVIANFGMQTGEYIIAGAPLFSLIDDAHIWVEANFKETDLTYLQPGQPATIEIDSFPNQNWQGRVASITPGTGSEFSLLPAQNSTGNWVKVVQRITVKLEIDPATTPASLRAGMSAVVKVDTGHVRQLSSLL